MDELRERVATKQMNDLVRDLVRDDYKLLKMNLIILYIVTVLIHCVRLY